MATQNVVGVLEHLCPPDAAMFVLRPEAVRVDDAFSIVIF
jgi:hypothetical protein